MLQTADAVLQNPWKFCLLCQQKQRDFASAFEFKRHLRMAHCTKEGGSYVCHYGRNNVCPSLPVEGVNENDYINHVEKVHISLNGRYENVTAKYKYSEKMTKQNNSNDDNRYNNTQSFAVVKYKDDSLKKGDKSWINYPAQNLSTVLNDPRKGARETDIFTRIWGESFVPHEVVPLTLLPSTPKSFFNDYWKKYEFKYMQHERLKRTNLAPHTGKKSATKEVTNNMDETDTIPEMFFQPTFNLEEPSTFNDVLPWSNIQTKSSVGLYKKNSSKLLQEKLSHYLDITEVRIAQQIATKSEEFFKAMTSQDVLQHDVQKSCQDVKQLRLQLVEMRDRLVKEPLNVMRLFRLRDRYEIVEDKLKLVATLHQTQPTIQLLLASADFVSALDLIDTSLEVLQQELAGLQCFRHLGSQLTEMKKVIERMMSADFLDFALSIIYQPHSEETTNTLHEKERLMSVVFGLLRQKKHNFLNVYKSEVFTIIKSSIKKTAHDAVAANDTDEDQSAKFGDYIRSLEHAEWLMVLEAVFCDVLQILKNMKVIHESLSKVFSLAAGVTEKEEDTFFVENNSFLKKNDCDKMVNESKELLFAACELTQSRCSKVILMRSKDGILDKLSSREFVVLARIVETFACDCEEVCGRQSQNLRGTLLTQAKKFVRRFHEEKQHKLGKILDVERWVPADVPRELQLLVDSISHDFEKIPSKTNEYNSGSSCSTLVVQGQKFTVVGTLLLLMQMIVDYCQCLDDVPMLATDILTRLCEILKLFNSRSCQLVLGAGSLQTVGLKTISAKHLALVAQCLEVIMLHIHVIKNHFEIRLSTKQFVLLTQFDQILKDYSNHRHEIICKIVNLMEGIFLNKLTKYEVRPPMPSTNMRSIVQQIIKLRDLLSTVLVGEQMESLFRDIRRCFKTCYAEKLASLNIKCDGGPQHGLVTSDLLFYSSSLKKYSGFTDLDNRFDDIWTAVKETKSKFDETKYNKLLQKQMDTKPNKYPHR